MRKLIYILMLLSSISAYGQDPQFSQYYSAPLILNPAMAGATDCYRIGMNARTQWTGLPGGAFNTASLFADLNYPDLRSGFGLLVLHDNIGTPRMSSNEISGLYSYLLPVSKQLNIRMGLQGTYVWRKLDYCRLIFEDQYTGTTVTSPTSNDPMTAHNTRRYADFSAGALVFGEDRYWLGFSAHHLNRPDHGFFYESRLPIKYSLHGGYNFYKKDFPGQSLDDAFRIIPTFMYKAQAKFDQLDLGIYFIQSSLMFGLWYRGIPVKRDFNIYNRDAIDIQVGLMHNDFSFTYSYDFTISKLSIVNTHGSHEISLIYLFCLDWPKNKRPPKHVRKLPCPDFKKSMKYKKNFLGF
ncbi:MAG: type IX secretion system membrane protein PorP/SprF [Cytophagaceae bacterium]